MRFIIITFLLVLSSILNIANAVIIENVNVINNKRISKETILTYGQIEIKKDYNDDQINQILKNLYDTNFFENIEITVIENTLSLKVVENKIIQEVIVNGIKSKTMKGIILDNLFSKDKSPFLITKVKQDTKKIKTNLDLLGYYFSKVDSKTLENSNDTVDLIFDIELGEKAEISKIEFIGDKKIKDRKLRNVIVSEEGKFWKFISKNKFLNTALIIINAVFKNLFLEINFQNLPSSLTITFLNFLSFIFLSPINSILDISAFSPSSISNIRSTVSFEFSRVLLSTLEK